MAGRHLPAAPQERRLLLTRGRAVALLLAVAVAVAAAAAYWPVRHHPFVNYDDDVVLVDNPRVRDGLTRENVAWALTTTKAANWVPLTWLSHLLDAQLFGMDAGAHHLVSLALHAAAAALLLGVTRGMTGALWRSALVAALFALHPLHVESVAWATLRRDVLSGLLGIAAVGLWARYARRPTAARYAAAALALALGLTAKPVLVTWPLLFLLLDWWPLGRLRRRPGAAGSTLPTLLLEKLPLLAIAAGAGAVTLVAQRGAIATLETVPAAARVANALGAYASYLGKALLPRGLAVFYPHPGGSYSAAGAAAAALLLAGLTALAVGQRRRRPWLLAGWLWFVGTLLPVIGLVQAGDQAMADRYTYLPLTGLFIAAAWGLAESASCGPRARASAAAVAAAGLVALGVACRAQVRLWRDDETLFRHAIAVTAGNHLAHDHLGVALDAQGRTREAVEEYRRSLAIRPGQPHALSNLGAGLAALGRSDEALARYREALALKPDFPEARANLGNLLVRLGRDGEALAQYGAALAARPDFAAGHYNLAGLLYRRGDREGALRHYREAVRLDPADPDARNNLGVVLAETGRQDEAVAQYREALRLRPGFPDARWNLESELRGMREGINPSPTKSTDP